ncbi:hypothetical protein SERLADRAFT_366168 [Serpula lacrymans var. lacrymans S7.9]|uniref:Uncharacterized protein n=1 Tax=Serpula lacrymans var. lacrymans (strain S7.9) TaxID=578457 RepID=F8NKP6_SERL9|nr:uncharacterized protein SERLADRAFT_366168 [Serpula lacrymans var. lacrymans S7.9]EGO28458.1 hypothetical protein SERLADRAFT_366168 [Serpula lacrymans var. lacrymans S7.9]
MSAATVEHSFTMWAERKISWDPPVAQPQTGAEAQKVNLKTSSYVTFSDTNWGEASHYYSTSIKGLKLKTLNDTVTKASAYITGKGWSKQLVISGDGDVDPQACLVDI